LFETLYWGGGGEAARGKTNTQGREGGLAEIQASERNNDKQKLIELILVSVCNVSFVRGVSSVNNVIIVYLKKKKEKETLTSDVQGNGTWPERDQRGV